MVRRWALVCALLALLALGSLVLGLALHTRVLATFLTILIAFCLYFVADMALMPRVRYLRHLRDIGEGLSHDTECELVRVSEATRVVDGVAVFDVLCRVGISSEDERLFYFDALKPLPRLTQGDRVKITSFGSYITAIQKAETT